MSRLRDLVELTVRALTDNPEAVQVTEVPHRDATLVEVSTAPGDLGRVIGRQGRTAGAIRTLLDVVAEQEGRKATLEFRDRHGEG